MLAILAFEVTIYRHQEYYRCRNNLTVPVTKPIFHDITRAHLDDGLVNCVKYFINYFFYKFGLEVNCNILIFFRLLFQTFWLCYFWILAWIMFDSRMLLSNNLCHINTYSLLVAVFSLILFLCHICFLFLLVFHWPSLNWSCLNSAKGRTGGARDRNEEYPHMNKHTGNQELQE